MLREPRGKLKKNNIISFTSADDVLNGVEDRPSASHAVGDDLVDRGGVGFLGGLQQLLQRLLHAANLEGRGQRSF